MLSCTSPLIPYPTQIEGIPSSAKCKLVKEFKQVDGFVQNALQRNCFDVFEQYLNEIKSVSFSAIVVHKPIHFVFSLVLKCITFSAILLLFFP